MRMLMLAGALACALGLGACGGDPEARSMQFALDPGADGCAKKAGSCLAVRLLGAGTYDGALVTLARAGGGAGATGTVGGPFALPTTIVVADFEDRGIAASQVGTTYLVLLRGGLQVFSAALSPRWADGAHVSARVDVP